MSVEYITMPGWKSNIAGCKVYEDLPANAKKYIETIEQYLNIPGIYEYIYSFYRQTKGAFTYDIRCFGGIFDLPTYLP